MSDHVLEMMDTDSEEYRRADATLPRFKLPDDPDAESAVNSIIRWDGKPMRVAGLTLNQFEEYLLPARDEQLAEVSAELALLERLQALCEGGDPDRPAFDILIDRIAGLIDEHLAGPDRGLSVAFAAHVNLGAAQDLLPGLSARDVCKLFATGLVRRMHPDISREQQHVEIDAALADLGRIMLGPREVQGGRPV